MNDDYKKFYNAWEEFKTELFKFFMIDKIVDWLNKIIK